jgi:hypothetical protein
MKTITFFIALFLFSGIVSKAQTYHSSLQIDAEKTFNISKGISRENITFTVDLLKLKFSIKSSFLTFEDKYITHLDSRFEINKNGERVLRSEYKVIEGFNLYIEEYTSEQSEIIVKYSKIFALELMSDGVRKSFMVCYITERQPSIKYDPNTPFANYQIYKSDYRVEGVENLETKRTEVIIKIDTTNNYFALNGQRRYGYTYVKSGEITFLEKQWNFNKYQLEGSGNEFLTIYSTETPANRNVSLYNKIIVIETVDLTSNKTTSKAEMYVNTSPPINNGQYYEEPDGGY